MKLDLAIFGSMSVFLTLLITTCARIEDKNNIQTSQVIEIPTNVPEGIPYVSTVTPDQPSHGGTITFQNIGTIGWYPSRRDPLTGPCDFTSDDGCCQGKHYCTTDSLTPWDEELIMTLRGPMVVKQVAVYQPNTVNSSLWDRISFWDNSSPTTMQGIAFKGNGTEKNGFQGIIGNTCLVDVSTDKIFKTGAGSIPYCPASGDTKYCGWDGSKMIIIQATMPRVASGVIDAVMQCGTDKTNNWYDAPWIGFSHGEMVRSGAFGSCHCYAKDGEKWWLADGCGQFNAFEVVNDNNDYQNFDLFSTNFFGYGGYVGEGPCGKTCDVSGLDLQIDLVNKSTGNESPNGAVADPTKGPGAAFRRPTAGYRYFVILFDIRTRTVQLMLIHPQNVPSSVRVILPALPEQVSRSIIEIMLALRLPKSASVGVIRPREQE
jgi:hypothetical protein